MSIPAHSRPYEVTRDTGIGAVYGWMAVGLCLTAFVSTAIVSSPALFAALLANRGCSSACSSLNWDWYSPSAALPFAWARRSQLRSFCSIRRSTV